jgi:uncharacterized protein YcgI (DUF1989 family)
MGRDYDQATQKAVVVAVAIPQKGGPIIAITLDCSSAHRRMCMADKPESHTTDAAPHPWRVEVTNKLYFRIVDAAGKPVCDFFPEVAVTRGREVTLDIAHRIVSSANSAVLHGQES